MNNLFTAFLFINSRLTSQLTLTNKSCRELRFVTAVYIGLVSKKYILNMTAMIVEHELKLNRTEMSMIRLMCGVKLNERKKSEELRELLGLEPVSLMIKKSRLRWFGQVERKDDND